MSSAFEFVPCVFVIVHPANAGIVDPDAFFAVTLDSASVNIMSFAYPELAAFAAVIVYVTVPPVVY